MPDERRHIEQPPGPSSGDAGDDEQRLARLHLRLGLLTLARAELENLAARGARDAEAMGLLAEARWRSGDGDGAVEAARAHLAGGGADEVAICIAAEAAAADGEIERARELMDRLGPPDPALVDRLFAGLPKRAPWPVASDAAPAGEAIAGDAGGRPAAAGASAMPGPRDVGDVTADPDRPADDVPPGDPGDVAAEDHPTASTGRRERSRRGRGARDAGEELNRARGELGSRPDRAFVRLALVLRLDPTLAPAVLEAIATRRDPAAALIRGDAQRLLGRHLEAEAAYDAAADSLEAT
jgi:hypothetical protein